MAEQFTNNAFSTLAAGIAAGSLTLSVVSGATFLTTPTFRILVDSEYMMVTGVSGTVFTVTRGIEGSIPASHALGAVVSHVFTAGAMTAMASMQTSANSHSVAFALIFGGA